MWGGGDKQLINVSFRGSYDFRLERAHVPPNLSTLIYSKAAGFQNLRKKKKTLLPFAKASRNKLLQPNHVTVRS